jgi:hypothetical protein
MTYSDKFLPLELVNCLQLLFTVNWFRFKGKNEYYISKWFG